MASKSLILPGGQHWLRRRLDHAAQRYGVMLRPVLQVDSAALAKSMVRGGLGCTVLPHTAMQEDVARGALAFRPIGQPALGCTYFVTFRRAASNTLVAPLAAMACEAIATLAEGGAWPGAEFLMSKTEEMATQ